MDRELLVDKRIYERNNDNKPKNDWAICQKQKEAGAEAQKEQSEENLVEILSKTMGHYFPEFNEWLKQISDPRDQEAIEFSTETQIWTGLLLFLTKRGARKKISEEMRSQRFRENLQILSEQEDLRRVAHGDTVDYAYMRFKEDEFEKLEAKLIRSVLRKRGFEKYRLLNKYYMVAIDASGIYSFDERHCEQCLVRETGKGKKKYFHYKLQASLVTMDGMCLPLASEWIENELNFDKQDCEIKAFYRLIKKLRKLYRQMPMCILLDGLYAGEPQFEAMEKKRMEWIVVFKEGAMTEVYDWTMKWKAEHGPKNILVKEETKEIGVRNKRTHQEKLTRSNPKHLTRTVKTRKIYSWMQGIKHWNNQRRYNLLTCRDEEAGRIKCDYTWLLSNGLLLCRETVERLSKGGRCRWKQENEGFNTQKNGGYRLEHCYSRDPVAMKIWNKLLEIAHIIAQLIERGSLITKEKYGSIRNIATRMFEHFRYFIYKKPKEKPKIQIRIKPYWDTS